VSLPCFPAGTPVWTGEGPRAIEALAVGTWVLACDPGSREVHRRQVTRLHENQTLWLYHVVTEAGAVHATGDHPFWVEDTGGWVAARDLRAGMRLRRLEGGVIAIDAVELVETAEIATYNLSIDRSETYFVGPGLLVHNMGAPNHGKGPFLVYEGINLEFPEAIYIGKTNDRKKVWTRCWPATSSRPTSPSRSRCAARPTC
jgi:hypothetical protein